MENPKPPAAGGAAATAAVAAVVAARPVPVRSAAPVIMERFRALLREAGEEEVVRVYEEVLGELTFNSKPIITELTIIADQHARVAEGIADAICARITEVPVDQKLPSLYLLDSIVKNIGRDYVRHFAVRLPKVFCEAYKKIHPSQHPAMRHLFGTWSQVFPSSVLRKIEDELQFSPSENQRPAGVTNTRHSESPSPRPSHGIHVNPKYLEAQRQFKHSTVMHQATRDNVQTADFEGERAESPRGWSAASPKFHHGRAALQAYGQKSFIEYGEELDHRETLPPRIGMARANSPHIGSKQTSILNAEGPLSNSRRNMPRPLSPQTLRSRSPPVDVLPRVSSPKRVIDRPSPSHSGFGPSLGRLADQNGYFDRNWASDDVAQKPEVGILANGYRKQNARELIDAYGNYRGRDAPHERFPKLQRLDANGILSDTSTRKWISSEEEEYAWEDMSPTLTDRSRRNSMPSSVPTSGTLSMRIGFPGPNAGQLDSEIGRRSWPGQVPRPPIEDPTLHPEDRIPLIGHGDGSISRKFPGNFGSHNESLSYHQSSHRAPDPGRMSHTLPQSWQSNFGPPLRVQAPQIPSTISRTPLPTDNEMSFKRLATGGPYDALNMDASVVEKHFVRRLPSPAPASVEWPPHHSTHPQTLASIPPDLKHVRSAVDVIENVRPLVSQGPNSSLFVPHHQYDAVDRKTIGTSSLTQPCQLPDLFSLSQRNQGTVIRNHPLPNPHPHTHPHAQEVFTSFVPNMSASSSQNLLQGQGHGGAITPAPVGAAIAAASLPPNSLSVPLPAVPPYGVPPIHGGGVLPPLPPGPPPAPLQMGPSSQVGGSMMSSSSSAFSGLLSTLMAQGVISLKPPTQSQDSVGVEFNADFLKVRHECAINALYTDLPRQCTTCGLRFKCQEEHSSHMDWHVTKNRMSRNRKQKPSRKWFVSAKEWLSGAETLGNDAVPGFLPTESVPEKKEEMEMAVPADEDQTVCALCAEPFEDFYSDETEEWMYRGAVYMNAPDGNVDGLERSQLGPIVHAKCRSGSNDASGQA